MTIEYFEIHEADYEEAMRVMEELAQADYEDWAATLPEPDIDAMAHYYGEA